MCKFKGRHESVQYMPAKPIKYGFKVFGLADAKNGYMYNYELFLGKKYQPGMSIERVVLNLLKGLEHKMHHVYMDNYYTSVKLFEELTKRGILATGTLK